MKKQVIIIFSILAIIFLSSGCGTEIKDEQPANSNSTMKSNSPVNSNSSINSNSTAIDGRIIEVVEGSHIIIRNEKDTSIYYQIDISGGLVITKGVNGDLEPDHVITADVEILNSDTIPREAKLIAVTGNKVPGYRIINAKEAKAMMDAGDVLIVDVRTVGEYESGFIPEAYNVPLDGIDKNIKNITENKDDTILVYCRSGNRSKVAARILTEMGYKNVYDFGGIAGWSYNIVEP